MPRGRPIKLTGKRLKQFNQENADTQKLIRQNLEKLEKQARKAKEKYQQKKKDLQKQLKEAQKEAEEEALQAKQFEKEALKEEKKKKKAVAQEAPKNEVRKPQGPKFNLTTQKTFKKYAHEHRIHIESKEDFTDYHHQDFTQAVIAELRKLFKENGPITVKFAFMVDMESAKRGAQEHQFCSDLKTIINERDIPEIYEQAKAEIIERIETYQKMASDWVIVRINNVDLRTARFIAGAGASYIELPEYIKNKQACINVQNTDNRCFEYSVLCGLHYDDIKIKPQRVSKYEQYKGELDFTDISFPVEIDDIKRFEELNEIPINVLGYNEDDDEAPIYPLYMHNLKSQKKPITLLMIENEETNHYVYVRRLNALFQNQKTHTFICDNCLIRCSTSQALERHVAKNKCTNYTGEAIKHLPQEGEHVVQYENKYIKKQLRVPFVIYADGESILKPVEVADKSANSQIYQYHEYSYIGCKFVSQFPEVLDDEYHVFSGSDCVQQFLRYCFEMQNKAWMIITDNKDKIYKDEWYTSEEHKRHKEATHCHICKRELKGDKVFDHCHITRKFRGSAHSVCNQEYCYTKNSSRKWMMPVMFHNLKGYDSHFIMQAIGQMAEMKKNNIKAIPLTMDKYLSFSIGGLQFLDTYQFMLESLDKMVKNLNDIGKPLQTFKQFNKVFARVSPQLNELLRQKGVFPYDWFDSQDKMIHAELPPIKEFYSQLYEADIDEKDYQRAQQVFEEAKCENFGDYMHLYLKTDVLLLADVTEYFRDLCMEYYDLDPCHFMTSPGFSWVAMLKMTEAKIECFKDGQMDMLDMTKNGGMRGGISVVSHRYAKANNKYMKDYDPKVPSSHILYVDANNLYGWAMSQYLPTGNYRWADLEKYTLEYIKSMKEDAKVGALLEYDLHIPGKLHDYFNDYPVAPETCYGEFSPAILERMNQFEHNTSKVAKLIPNLRDKVKYVSNYRNLQLYLSLGCELVKVHRVLEFEQSDFLKEYIDFNTDKRSKATNDFEKNFFKLLNNSVFGKTMENIENRIDVKITADGKKFVKDFSKPHAKNFKIFSEGLIAYEMGKTLITYNKPLIVGMCILDISKILMYDFHYNTIKTMYGDKAKLLFTDTDSLCYHIHTEDVYKDLLTIKDQMDFSGYPKTHKNYSVQNKKVIGKFTEEASSNPIVEFCGLRSKMNCMIIEKGLQSKTKCTAKGVKSNTKDKLRMENYKQAIFGTTKGEWVQKATSNFIRQQNHQVYSVKITKVSLCGFDDKRYVLEDNVSTLAHGHYKIGG